MRSMYVFYALGDYSFRNQGYLLQRANAQNFQVFRMSRGMFFIKC